ncbi:MAG: CHASE domain-containing protein [Candidatus Hydrogenedentes bacterium]|nr:CHASE domain-containing protein [Candidatus Hydrogenedentota bacterium]
MPGSEAGSLPSRPLTLAGNTPEPAPARGRLLGYSPVAIILLLGAAGAYYTHGALLEQDRLDRRMDFERDARTYFRAFEQRLQLHLNQMDALTAFFALDELPSPRAYQTFVGAYLERAAGVELIIWLPRENATVQAPYVMPAAHGAALEGRDFSADPDVARAMRNAAEKARPFYVSNAVLLGGLSAGNVLALAPVYRGNAIPGSAEGREEALRGYIAAVFRLQIVLESALDLAKERRIDAAIFDPYAADGIGLLAMRPAPSRREPVAPERLRLVPFSPDQDSIDIDLGTRRWSFVCTATPEYLKARPTKRPLFGAAAAMGFAVLVALYAVLDIDRRHRVERIVAVRTAELRGINVRLREEIGERKRFEQECDELMRLVESSNVQLHALNHRLARSNEDLQDFAYVASHDLQEPLRKIRVFAGRLRQRYEHLFDERGAEYVDLIESVAGRMQALISDLLKLSRITTHGEPFRRVDLNTVLEQVLSDLAVRLDESAAQIDVAPLPLIEADPMQMHQLFLNLLNNALKYRAAGRAPRIVVATAPENGNSGHENGYICLDVQDNGMGIEPENLEKIFTLFHRVTESAEHEGAGVGLAVCRRIVERHGGSITVQSVPGAGACFRIALPSRHGAAEAAAPDATRTDWISP